MPAMIATRFLSASLAVAMLLPVSSAFADSDDDSSSSASSAVSSVDSSRDAVRVERCARFSRGDDYERCVRLIRRMPSRGGVSSSSSSSSAASSFESDAEWKWNHVLNKMEEKVNSMVKFASVMAKKFCRDQTDDIAATSQECMLRMKQEMQARVAKLIDTAFRGELPSSR